MASIGDIKTVKGTDGNYLVETRKDGYIIQKEGEDASMQLVYDKARGTWSVVADNESTDLLKLNGDGTAQLTLPDGNDLTVTIDAQGVAMARQAIQTDTYFALRN